MTEQTRSLWEQFHSEVEPWRRGRATLALIALVNLLAQAFLFTAGMLLGDTESLLLFAAVSVLFWLQFYFIWIGVHWIRWLAGAWAGLIGFVYLIWGWRDGNGFAVGFACVNLLIGIYLCLSPSVYFFAKHQQERRNWIHSALIAAVFCLLFLTFYFGTRGLGSYRAQLEIDAHEFADTAFARIFGRHDTYFLLHYMTEEALKKAGGRSQATAFLQHATMYAGDVHDIKSATGQVMVTYRFPTQLTCAGLMKSDAVGQRGPIQLNLTVISSGAGWQIQDIWWRDR